MKRLILSISVLSLIIGTSCSDRKPVFERSFQFKNHTWDRFNKIIFNAPINDVSVNYDISLALKPDKSFMYDEMPVYIIMNTPSGEERMKELKIKVKDQNKFLEEVDGNPSVIKTLLWKGLHISDKGNCKISIENMVPRIQTEGLDKIGIVVTKSVSN